MTIRFVDELPHLEVTRRRLACGLDVIVHRDPRQMMELSAYAPTPSVLVSGFPLTAFTMSPFLTPSRSSRGSWISGR